MSLKVCSDCGAAYAPAPACPQCGGGVFRFSWEEEMPKATVEGGPSGHEVPAAEELPEEKSVKRGTGRPRKDTAGDAERVQVMDVAAPVASPPRMSATSPPDYDG